MHCVWHRFNVLYTLLTTVILRVGILRSKTLTLIICISRIYVVYCSMFN